MAASDWIGTLHDKLSSNPHISLSQCVLHMWTYHNLILNLEQLMEKLLNVFLIAAKEGIVVPMIIVLKYEDT